MVFTGWVWPEMGGWCWCEFDQISTIGRHDSANNWVILMSWFVGVTAVSQALLTVILATLAAIALAFSARGFSGHKMAACLIDAGFTLVALIIMIFAQGIGMSITG